MRSALFVFLLALVHFSLQQQQVDRITVDSYDEGNIGIVIILAADVLSTDPPVTNQTFYTSPDGINSTAILGGERDLQYNVTNGPKGRVFSASVSVVNGQGEWEISTPNGGNGIVDMQYDGLDGGSMTLNIKGLIGVKGNTAGFDITENGKGIAFHVVATTDHDTNYNFNVYSPDGSHCQSTVAVPGGGVQKDTLIYFKNFTGSCDFTKVGAIEVFVDALQNVDTITNVFTTYGNPDVSATPTPSPSPAPPSSSKSPTGSFIPASKSPSPTPVNPSQTRTPSSTPSPSPITTCMCNCPHFKCGLVFDRPGDDDDNSVSENSKEVHYRPVFYYAQDDDFANIHGDDGLETFVLLGGEVAKFKYGVDDVAVYLYKSDATPFHVSLSLIFISLLVLLF